MSGARLPDEAYVAALAGLPHLSASRLRRLLADGDPARAWGAVQAGRIPGWGEAGLDARSEADPVPDSDRDSSGRSRSRWSPEALARAWCAHAGRTDPAEVWAAYTAASVRVLVHGAGDYPNALLDDPEAPPVLFCLGELAGLDHRTAALVGTRACTHYGEEVAAELGFGLARSGVSVVSGLALGIDGAAHRGALAAGGAPPLGVVGSALDVIYPPRHARLWHQMTARGGLVSEAPLGAAAEAWRFPWRNRLIAALCDVVVVVESHRAGGALLTVEAAIRRGVTVMAVPGSVRSSASAGSNALIADGCAPVRDVEDVLVALGLGGTGPPAHPVAEHVGDCPVGAPPFAAQSPQAIVWLALEEDPTPTEAIMRRTGLSLGDVAATLDQLAEGGWARAGDGWWERVHK